MSDPILTKIRLQDGVWQGQLSGPYKELPKLDVMYQDQPVGGVSITAEGKNTWLVTIPVPRYAIADGVQCFVISDSETGRKLGDFTLIVGDTNAADLRGEVELLRAELDMLKRAFRRHCLETSQEIS